MRGRGYLKTAFGVLVVLYALSLMVNVNVALGWTLSGTVYGNGSPISGAAITVVDSATSQSVASTSTDASGDYVVNLVTAGCGRATRS